MQTHARTSPHPLVWVAAVAVILFSLVGIAAIVGWIPTSIGHSDDAATVSTAPANTPAKPPAATTTQEPMSPVAQNSAPYPSTSAPAKMTCAECGVVESVSIVEHKGEGSGLGAAGGAVVGGLLGHSLGNGHGNQIATVIGAVGGAVAGNQVEKQVKATKSYEVTVRLDDGRTRVFHNARAPAWRSGDRVRVVNNTLHSNA